MTRGNDRRPSACSRVICSPSIPRGNAVRRGFDFFPLVLAVLALLHIQAVRAAANGDLLTAVGVLAKDTHALLQCLPLVLAVLDRQPPRVLTVRIIRTADEAAVSTQLQAQPPIATGGQARASLPSSRVGKKCGPRSSSRAAITSLILRSFV